MAESSLFAASDDISLRSPTHLIFLAPISETSLIWRNILTTDFETESEENNAEEENSAEYHIEHGIIDCGGRQPTRAPAVRLALCTEANLESSETCETEAPPARVS